MGSTGTAGTKAPVLKRSMQRPSPHVPSGAITNMGNRRSFALQHNTYSLRASVASAHSGRRGHGTSTLAFDARAPCTLNMILGAGTQTAAALLGCKHALKDFHQHHASEDLHQIDLILVGVCKEVSPPCNLLCNAWPTVLPLCILNARPRHIDVLEGAYAGPDQWQVCIALLRDATGCKQVHEGDRIHPRRVIENSQLHAHSYLCSRKPADWTFNMAFCMPVKGLSLQGSTKAFTIMG